MPKFPFTKFVCFALLLLCAFPAPAQNDNREQELLTSMIRQLDMMERVVSESRTAASSSRYHLDYARLQADIERIRDGIRDYLTPQRTQPRDPVELHGQYRVERIGSRQ